MPNYDINRIFEIYSTYENNGVVLISKILIPNRLLYMLFIFIHAIAIIMQ